jgi:hypothetical protein
MQCSHSARRITPQLQMHVVLRKFCSVHDVAVLLLISVSGWQIYFTEIGGQTPCYTLPTITNVPASSSTVSGLTVITQHVFTRKYELSKAAIQGSKGLGAGAIAGISVGGVAGVGIVSILIFIFLRRRKARKAPQTYFTPAGEGEMVITSPASATHELASPHTIPRSPASGRSAWVSPTSPPAYDQNLESIRTKARTVAQELPGSTFIFEHHPAFTGQEDGSTTAAPSSPPRTPGRSSPQSMHAKTTPSLLVVSPLGSPRLR